jgi:hypothetical protein
MVNGKTLLSILTKFVKGSEVGGNARIQIQMPNGDLHDITEVKLMENMLIGSYETHRIVKTAAPSSVILYPSSAIHELQSNIRDAKIAAQDDWTAIQEALIGGD